MGKQRRYISLAKKVAEQSNYGKFRHGAILVNMDRSITQGSTIYVVRINREGLPRMSKPCPMCEGAMKHVGVKKVVYTNRDGRIENMIL